MEFTRVSRSSVSDAAFVQLRDEILSGRLVTETALPSERSLSEAFGVNRQAVREAMKRLDQAGLVEIHHGGTTRVRDYRRSAGLDLLPHLLMRGGQVDNAVVRSVMEMRACIGPDAARLCAMRAVPGITEQLRDLSARMAEVHLDHLDHVESAGSAGVAGSVPLTELGALDWELWELVVDGADNIAYRLAFNALRQTAAPLDDLLLPLRAAELQNSSARRALIAAITDGRAERAAAAARRVLTLGSAEMAVALSGGGRIRSSRKPKKHGSISTAGKK